MPRTSLYPPANAAVQWFADDFPGTAFAAIEKLCLHTTEGAGWPDYRGGAIAPHLTAMPVPGMHRLAWRQHFPIPMSSRALVHPPGTTPTNTDGVVQVELVGTCLRTGPGLHWADAPDWALLGLADLLAWLHVEWALPLRSSVQWRACDAAGDTQRLSGPAWDAYRGVLGHEHAPRNDHRDPGALDAARIIRFAGADPIEQEDQVPLTDADVLKIVRHPEFTSTVRAAVWQAVWPLTNVPGGPVEPADVRLARASHPERAADAIAQAVVGRLAAEPERP